MVGKDDLMPSGAVSHFVDRIVKTATDEAERAAERVRSEAGLQLASAQASANRLEGELDVARGELIATRERFDAEHLARTRAEAAWKDAQTHYDQMIAARESELQRQRTDLERRRQECETLLQQLESARAEREALTAVLQTVQSAIQRAMKVGPVNSAPKPSATSDRAENAAPHPLGVGSERTPVLSGREAAPLATRNDATGRQPVPSAAEAVAGLDPTLTAYVASLLGWRNGCTAQDLESGLGPAELWSG